MIEIASNCSKIVKVIYDSINNNIKSFAVL